MVNFKNSYIIVFFILLFIIVHAQEKYPNCVIYLEAENSIKIKLNVEIAHTPSEREKGLMFREMLNDTDGMLFVFDREEKLNFWMKNTLIPLDIAYIDKNGIINEIHHMKPLDVSRIYNSIKPAMFALEVNQDWFSRHKIKTGSKIEFNGCLSKQNSLIKR